MAIYTAYECWLASWKNFQSRHGQGEAVVIAKALGKSPGHLRDILREDTRASQELQEQISDYYGLPLWKIVGTWRADPQRPSLPDTMAT